MVVRDRLKEICRIGLVLVLFASFSCKKKTTDDYFPEVGADAVYQLSVELKNNLNVLSLALEPGFEDLSALAYFRFGKGANIMSAYLTNGEAGDSDVRVEYPNYLAATRRSEADEAISYLGSEAYFLNFPHIVAAKDSAAVREKWPKKTMETKIVKLINHFKPDIILLARDWAAPEQSLWLKILKEDLLSALRKNPKGSAVNGSSDWRVARVIADNPGSSGNELPIDQRHPRFDKKYREIAAEAATKYKSIALQRNAWMKGEKTRYSIVFPSSKLAWGDLDRGPDARHTKRLESMGQQIYWFSKEVVGRAEEDAIRRVASLLDSLNYKVGRRYEYSVIDARALFHWKGTLDRLKCALLGIRVMYSVSEDILTMRQLTHVTIEEVEGLSHPRNTSVVFGGIEDGWIINEGFEKKFPYKPGESYRLLTPSNLNLTIPAATYGAESTKLRHPVFMFIVHRAPTPEKTFVHRSAINFRFAPKFTTEILTPIVSMIPDEKLIVRFTNHSRDGVKDTLRVDHHLVESTPAPFRLNQKEASSVDTLTLTWKRDVEDGSYLIPLDVQGFRVGNFAVRKFPVEVSGEKRMGVIAGVQNSPVEAALSRLDLSYVEVNPEYDLTDQISGLDVVIVERRALSLKDKLKDRKEDIERFVEGGGHIIFLSQDADAWNKMKLWPKIKLSPTQKFDEQVPVESNSEHAFLSTPNKIQPEVWYDWLYLRAHNMLQTDNAQDLAMPVLERGSRSPLLVTKRKGLGRLTYVNLALQHQLMNIHPGVFRLFANIISI